MARHSGTATSYIDAVQKLALYCTNNAATAVVVAGGGTGYTEGEILTVSGGTTTSLGATTLEVTSVTGGVIDAGGVKIINSGSYTANPTNDVSATGSTNDDATFTMTYTNLGWTEERNVVTTGSDREVILNGSGSGADEIFVGIKTYNDTSVFNWELAGFTGFDSGLTWENQAGISPGRHDNQGAGSGGAFVTMADTDAQSLVYWFTVDSYSITAEFRNGSSYPSAHLGWLNPAGTASEFPYPLYLSGNTSDPDMSVSDTDISNSSFADPISHVSSSLGPGLYRNPAGAWVSVSNCNVQGSLRQANTDWIIVPTGSPDTDLAVPVAREDLTFEDTFRFDDIIPQTGLPGSSTFDLAQTPNTGDDLTFLWPLTIVEQDASHQIHGEIRNCYWASAEGGIVSEDSFRLNGVDYRIFQSGNRTNTWAYWVMREN